MEPSKVSACYAASKVFRFKRRVEKLLHQLFLRAFVPLYTMISFSLIPCADV